MAIRTKGKKTAQPINGTRIDKHGLGRGLSREDGRCGASRENVADHEARHG